MTTHTVAGTALASAVAQARDDFAAAHPACRAAHEAACANLPGGNTRSVLFHEPFPLCMSRGEGAQLWDVDGQRFVDFLGDYTAGLLGHSNQVVGDAVRAALADGLSLSGHNTLEARLAAGICARMPTIERIRFTNSGTEANLLALATATALTGRRKVLVFAGGYHGSVLSFGSGPARTNVPHEWVVGAYNDTDGASALFDRHGAELAAVLVEPMLGAGGCVPGDPEFLHALRDRARECGALFVLDEVMTSRLAPGGLGTELGLDPDLTTLGKYFAGGLSFGAFGGRAEIMAAYDPRRPDALAHAGTFNNNVLSMAAGLAALEVVTPTALRELNDRGDRLRTGLNDAVAGRPVVFTGRGSMSTVHFTAGPVHDADDVAAADAGLKELFYFDLLADGCYLARRGMLALSLAVTDADCELLVGAVEGFVRRRDGLLTERFAPSSA